MRLRDQLKRWHSTNLALSCDSPELHKHIQITDVTQAHGWHYRQQLLSECRHELIQSLKGTVTSFNQRRGLTTKIWIRSSVLQHTTLFKVCHSSLVFCLGTGNSPSACQKPAAKVMGVVGAGAEEAQGDWNTCWRMSWRSWNNGKTSTFPFSNRDEIKPRWLGHRILGADVTSPACVTLYWSHQMPLFGRLLLSPVWLRSYRLWHQEISIWVPQSQFCRGLGASR